MTTRGEFRDNQLRAVLVDATKFPDATLDEWIKEAILDYSMHLPRQVAVTVDCVPGQRRYDFSALGTPASVYGFARLEYPAGQTPPRLLKRLSRESARFLGGPFYDVLPESAAWELGETPVDGEGMLVSYVTQHTLPLVDGTTLSVPDNHLEVLKAFVVWQAVKRLEVDQAVTPDPTSDLLTMLGLNAYRAERAYYKRLDEMKASVSKGAYGSVWVMDKWDGGY